jgi:hypothetical protein
VITLIRALFAFHSRDIRVAFARYSALLQLYLLNIRARRLREQGAGQQNCAQEIAIHRLDGIPPDVFEINQIEKSTDLPHLLTPRRSIVIDSLANLAVPIDFSI